jgi:hypothetical protein
MATTTPLVGLVKQAGSEPQDIDVINANLDKMEQAVKGKLTHPYGIFRKTDGFGTNVPTNTSTTLVGWTDANTEYPDLQGSTGALDIPYSSGLFTIPVNGVYYVECGLKWEQTDTIGSRRLSCYLIRGGVATEVIRDHFAAADNTIPYNYVSKMMRLSANDQIRFDAVSSSTNTIKIDASNGGLFIHCSIICAIRLD